MFPFILGLAESSVITGPDVSTLITNAASQLTSTVQSASTAILPVVVTISVLFFGIKIIKKFIGKVG